MSSYRAFETRQLPVARYVLFIADRSCRKIGLWSFDLSTALFHVTMYRQYARKVGTSANSALICYYLPRLKLSIALLSRKRGNERLVKVKGKCMFLYSAVSSLLDRSKSFTLHPLADLFIPRLTRRLITHISTTVYSQVFISTAADWTEASEKTKMPNFEMVEKGRFEPGLFRWRVVHSTTALHMIMNTKLRKGEYDRLLDTHPSTSFQLHRHRGQMRGSFWR